MKEVAEEADLSLDTARTHLKNVFAKVGVDRQSALVHEVLLAIDHLRLGR